MLLLLPVFMFFEVCAAGSTSAAELLDVAMSDAEKYYMARRDSHAALELALALQQRIKTSIKF